MKCIYQNKLNTQTPSKLHQQLLDIFSTQEEADYWFAITETEEFIDKFGNWKSDFNQENRQLIDSTNEIGEPEIKFNRFGLPYFQLADRSKLFLERKILNYPHEVREALVQSTMFDLFGDSIQTDIEAFENVNINSIFTDTTEGSIYDVLEGDLVALRDIKQLVVDRLQEMKIKVLERADIADNDENITTEEVESGKMLDLLTNQEKNSKDNASANIKFFLSFIPEMTYDENGDIVPLIKETDIDGRPFNYIGFNSFDDIWKKMEPVLAGTIDLYKDGEVISKLDNMLNKLNEQYPDNPTIQYIIQEVQTMPEYKQNEFVHAFDKVKNNYTTTLIKKIGNALSFKWIYSDRAVTPQKKFVKKWNANFKKSSLISVDKATGKPTFKQATAQLLYNHDEKGFLKFLSDVSKSNKQEFSEDLYNRLKNKLQYIGINISDAALRDYIFSFGDVNDNIINNSMMLNASHQLKYVFEALSKLKPTDVVKGLNINDIFSKKQFSKQLNALAKADAEYSKDLTENTIVGAESKKYWIYSVHSYLTNKMERLKQDTKSEIPFKSGFYTNSVWLNKFRDFIADPVSQQAFVDKFKLELFNNFRKEGEGDEGTDNSHIQKADQIVDQLNKTLNGVKPSDQEISTYYTPIPAGKSRLHHITGADFHYATLQGNGTIREDVIDIYVGYLIDEIERIQEELELIKDDQTIEENKHRLYKDYHWKLDKKGKLYYRDKVGNPIGNAFKVILFPEFSPFTQSELLKGLNIFNSKGELKVNSDTLKSNKKIRDFIQRSLAETIGAANTQLEELNLIKSENNKRVFPALDSSILEQYNITYTNDEAAIRAAVADFVLNSQISNIEFSKVFSGDYAFYKDLPDLSKRYPATYTDGINLNQKKGDNPNYKLAVLPNITVSSDTLTELQSYSPALAKAYSNINATDAQGYITLDRWKFIMERSNHWNPKYEEAYQRMVDGTPTVDDYKYAAQPVKGVHFENTDGKPTYIKYSAFPLIPSAIKGTSLERLNNSMLEQGVDEAVVVDGIKVGAIVPSDIIQDGKLKENIQLNSITLRNNNYKIQQDLRPKGIKRTLLGSQIKKTIITNFKVDELYDGVPGQQIIDEFNSILSEKSNRGLQRLVENLGISEDGTVLDKSKITEQVLRKLSDRGIGENLSNALKKELDFDYIANYRQRIQNSLMSIINDETVKIKTNGASFIQVSSQFISSFETEDIGIKWVGDNKPGKLKAPRVVEVNGKKKVLPGQVFITSNYIAKFIPNWNTLTPEQLKDKIDKRLLNLIGYRIPNQGMSSNDSLEVVGILPESYGDTIVPYVDITTKTGSDFDIDKMYVMVPNAKPIYKKSSYKLAKDYILNKYKGKTVDETIKNILDEAHSLDIDYTQYAYIYDKKSFKNSSERLTETLQFFTEEVLFTDNYISEEFKKDNEIGEIENLSYIEYNPNTPIEKQSEKAVENRLMELMHTILQDEKTYEDLMTPLDNPFLKNDINDLHGNEENKDIGNIFFSPMYQMDKKFDNMGGKSGVGLTANQLVDHAWTQLKDVYFPEHLGFVNEKHGGTSFAGEYDINGQYKITEALSWFLTAYVDIEKDPYVTKGNHNEYTSNTVFMLLRAGAPLSFINRLVGQPVVKKLAQIDSLRKSRVAERDTRDLNEAVIKELKLTTTQNPLSGKEIIERFIETDNKKEAIKKLEEKMEKDIKDLSLVGTDSWNKRQLEYLDLYDYYHELAQKFAKTVLSSKQDVNGGGKDFVSAYTDKNKKNEASAQGFVNFDAKFKNTFLGTAYENSTELSIKVMEQLFVTANRSSQVLYDAVYKLISPKSKFGLVEPDLGFEMEKSYFAHILGQTSMARNNAELKDMFIGNNTIYDKLLSARDIIPDNYFLNMLEVEQENGIKFVKMDSTKNNSTEALNEITRTWDDLFNHENEFIRNFARDLIVFSFYQSGFRTNIGSFFEHTPVNRLVDMVEPGIAEAKRTYSGGINGINQFVDKFFRNNWQNDRMVPYTKRAITNNILTVKPDKGTERGKYLMPYLKTSLSNRDEWGNEIKTITLWKNMGHTLNEKGKITGSYFIRVPKLGYNNQGRTIFEYTSDIPIDGNSMWDGNNFQKAYQSKHQSVVNRINKGIREGKIIPYTSVMDNVDLYSQIANNNRNKNNDLQKGLDEGLGETKC